MSLRLPRWAPVRPPAAATAVGLALCAAVLAAGCSAPAAGPGAAAAAGPVVLTAPPTDKPGGTLRLLATTMPSGDPGWADDAGSRALLRLVSRQLYDYPASSDPDVARSPRPDLAAAMPVVSPDATEYTVLIRSSARWDSQGVRRVTATDVARGIKRLCTPPEPSPYRGYFAATVVGFAQFCAQAMAAGPGAAAAFVEENDVEGVEVVGDDTVTFHLLAPASDFVEVLALPAASPVPFEALAHPPDSPEYLKNLIALGPYRFTAVVGTETYRLSRNPAWSASSDRIRPALPDHVTIRAGLGADTIQAELEAGNGDMAIDAAVPAARVDALAGQVDGRLTADDPGSTLLLMAGLGGPAGAALREEQVRRALPYCVDRSAIVAALGGPVRAHSATQLLQPGMTGYVPLDPFPTAGSGDPERCRAGLATTPGGPVTALTLLTSDSPVDLVAAGALQTAFSRSGIRLDVRSLPAADAAREAVGPFGQSWDLALVTATPQWFGDAGLTVFAPIVDGSWGGPRPADGGYRSEPAAELLGEALAATDEAEQEQAWGRLEHEVLEDAAVIPLAVTLTPRFHGANVRGFVTVPSLGGGDPTAVSLDLP